MMKKEKIRKVKREDLDRLVELCAAHADYEQCDYNSESKAELLSKHLFNESATLECIVAEVGGDIVGYTTFMKQFSTWDATYYVYLDCIYLDNVARGYGIGGRMMNCVNEAAKEMGCSEIQWQTPDFNARAISFYKRIGANSKSKERFFWEVK